MKKIRIDPEFRDLIPPLSKAEHAELTASILEHGVNTPVTVWKENGILLDGHNRYNICAANGIVRVPSVRISLPDRAAARAWIFEHQIARRNLTHDQIVMLAAMRGIECPRATALQRERAAELHAAGEGASVLAGKLSLALAWGAWARRVGKLAPRPPRGPSATPAIPVGHELAGLSTLTDGDGKKSAEWAKTRVAGADEPPTPTPPGFLLDRVSTMQRGDGSTVVQWTSASPEKVAQWDAIKTAVIEHVQTYVRPAESIAVPALGSADLLATYHLGDPHIGLMSWAAEVGRNHDLKIAEAELSECMREMVVRAPLCDECEIVNLGDFWHAQDDTQRTPKGGNKVDVDGRSGKVGQVGLRIVRTLIDAALAKHQRVTFRSLPGNHDPNSAFWLPEVMRAEYRNEPRVTVTDSFNPYQYRAWGECLLGWCHGDGAKLEALGEIMAADVPDLWGAASFRFWNTGHVHHWSQKELRGCFVDTHRTLANRDMWHHHSGYRSGQALKVNAYHKHWGLDSVAVVGVERVRAALKVAA